MISFPQNESLQNTLAPNWYSGTVYCERITFAGNTLLTFKLPFLFAAVFCLVKSFYLSNPPFQSFNFQVCKVLAAIILCFNEWFEGIEHTIECSNALYPVVSGTVYNYVRRRALYCCQWGCDPTPRKRRTLSIEADDALRTNARKCSYCGKCARAERVNPFWSRCWLPASSPHWWNGKLWSMNCGRRLLQNDPMFYQIDQEAQ